MLKELVLFIMLLAIQVIWIEISLTSFSGIILYLFASLCFRLTASCYLIGICTGAEAVRVLAVEYVAFVFSHTAGWLLVSIGTINAGLRDFLQS